MNSMLWNNALLAAVILIHAATPAAPVPLIYRIELAGNQTVWSEDLPRDSGAMVLFHRYPGGLLVSIKKTDVRRVTSAPRTTGSPKSLQTGRDILVGPLGGRTAPGVTGAKGAPEVKSLAPGERKDGTALLNPDRPYRPEWDSKQVPGLNLANPASANDYVEGKTLAYPPASAVQEAPGDPPKMPPSSGEPPKAPQ